MTGNPSNDQTTNPQLNSLAGPWLGLIPTRPRPPKPPGPPATQEGDETTKPDPRSGARSYRLRWEPAEEESPDDEAPDDETPDDEAPDDESPDESSDGESSDDEDAGCGVSQGDDDRSDSHDGMTEQEGDEGTLPDV